MSFGADNLHSEIDDKNNGNSSDIAEDFLLYCNAFCFEFYKLLFNQSADCNAESETEAFPEAFVVAADKEKRNIDKGAYNEQECLAFAEFFIDFPKQKRNKKTDNISAYNVHRPMYSKIEP